MITDEQVSTAAKVLRQMTLVTCTGVGKSGKLADLVASLWQSVGVPAHYVHATDLCHGGLNAFLGMDELDTAIVVFSHSGKTEEVVHLLEYVNQKILDTELWIVTSSSEAMPTEQFVDRKFTYDFDHDGSVHGTIPFRSLVEQLSFGARVASVIADDLTAEELLSGHPGGALAYAYKREMHDEQRD